MKVAFYTLGCKVNQYDSSAVAALFRERGYVVVPFSEKADVYVVNTCTVTAAGDKKSRQALRRARRQDGSAIVVAMGCYSQTDSAEVERETGADLVFGTGDHSEIVDTVERLLSE
ncbi:MAG: tRNA (N(6)-L-threonylcarbamoyladenosine(37)-C(2))-methylthiotransferase MtaB, partial [Firmicutes bacterium]|nr:tRNA (N(6)-L-threonylcarbamoyladenosine(37)-C(2))-methylthiotransferase MtaB [Bacillota bacterium]